MGSQLQLGLAHTHRLHRRQDTHAHSNTQRITLWSEYLWICLFLPRGKFDPAIFFLIFKLTMGFFFFFLSWKCTSCDALNNKLSAHEPILNVAVLLVSPLRISADIGYSYMMKMYSLNFVSCSQTKSPKYCWLFKYFFAIVAELAGLQEGSLENLEKYSLGVVIRGSSGAAHRSLSNWLHAGCSVQGDKWNFFLRSTKMNISPSSSTMR